MIRHETARVWHFLSNLKHLTVTVSTGYVSSVILAVPRVQCSVIGAVLSLFPFTLHLQFLSHSDWPFPLFALQSPSRPVPSLHLQLNFIRHTLHFHSPISSTKTNTTQDKPSNRSCPKTSSSLFTTFLPLPGHLLFVLLYHILIHYCYRL